MLSSHEKRDVMDRMREDGLGQDGLSLLGEFACDSDSEIRCRAAEVLCLSDSQKAEEILIGLLRDDDEMVRVNACDSLCMSRSTGTIDILKHHAIHDTWMVRGYAIASIADIAVNLNVSDTGLREFFEESLSQEDDLWVRIHAYRALYMLGTDSCLTAIIKALDNDDYHIRCAAANILSDIINKRNHSQIADALEKRLRMEDTNAVVSTIENALNRMKHSH